MIGTVDYQELAEQAAGNWAEFNSFAWFERPENPGDYAIVYTSNRDSDILDRANAKAIDDELSQFVESGDVLPQRHSHWACGYVDGYAIRVYDDEGEITVAFRCWCDMQAQLADYPILDESLYSEMELEAQNESWELWARADYIRAVERQLDVQLDDSDSSAIATAFQAACDRSNTYWESDSIDVDRVAEATTFEDVRALVVPLIVIIFEDGFPIVYGCIVGDEYRCELPLYSPEFDDCMEARDNGADSVTIGQHVYTWSVQ